MRFFASLRMAREVIRTTRKMRDNCSLSFGGEGVCFDISWWRV